MVLYASFPPGQYEISCRPARGFHGAPAGLYDRSMTGRSGRSFRVCAARRSACPVPGGTTASYKIRSAQLGLPMESPAVVLTLNVLLDFLRTAVNLFAWQCVLISASRKLGLVSSQNEQGLFPESSSQWIHSWGLCLVRSQSATREASLSQNRHMGCGLRRNESRSSALFKSAILMKSPG